VHNKKLIKSFPAHTDGASCIDITPDGTRLVTGGLDRTVRIWDLNNFKPLDVRNLPSQVFSLGAADNDIIATGLENSEVRVLSLSNRSMGYTGAKHHGPVLALKYSHSSQWFASTSKDGLLTGWRSPRPDPIFDHKEGTSILACDISLDDKYVVTGSGDRLATVYECL
jgi:WD40 repeat protein